MCTRALLECFRKPNPLAPFPDSLAALAGKGARGLGGFPYTRSNMGQGPCIASLSVHPSVRLGGVHEPPPGGVPFQAPAMPVRQVAEMDNGHRARPDLDVGVWLLARAD